MCGILEYSLVDPNYHLLRIRNSMRFLSKMAAQNGYHR